MKNYYLVAVASPSAKRQAQFTYHSEESYSVGSLVVAPFKEETVFGVVVEATAKPKFRTKPLLRSTGVVLPEKQLETLLWALSYYPTDQGAAVRLFVPPMLLKKNSPAALLPAAQVTEKRLPTLTHGQRVAIQGINNAPHISILYGETGTGKTIVYIELIRQQLAAGKSVILLAPEISLAEQLGNVIGPYISGIIRYNSLMTRKERREIWYNLAVSSSPQLIIGPRSSIFLPVRNLGMVIIDEAHDASYKQQQSPYYTTLQMAATLTKGDDTRLVYGSATPNVSDYYVAVNRGYPIFRLTERPIATESQLSTGFMTINLRDRSQFTRNNFLSDDVVERISQSSKNGKQSLLLLNRRGTAQLIQCESCAWQFRCSFCDHTLVYHKDKHAALCHYCGRQYPMPSTCPEDGGQIRLLHVGTKFIEEQCQLLFPHETILRIDADAIDRHTITDTMASIAGGEANILVGTQLLAKGLDLPLLNTIVILDASRQSSDYLGDERFYQLLHQVIGRGMRGHQAVQVLLQTARPDDPIITWATKEDWATFYQHELEEREAYGYPPFRHLAVFRYDRKTAPSAESTGRAFLRKLQKAQLKLEVLGPMPTVTAQKGKLEWQFIIKSISRKALVEAALLAPGDFTIDLDPIST